MRERGESRSNRAKAGSITPAALERSVAGDPDKAGMLVDWNNAALELAEPKAMLNMRVYRHVLELFRRSRPGYQTRINACSSGLCEGPAASGSKACADKVACAKK